MSSAYFDSASLHLSRGIRHIENKPEDPGEMRALPRGQEIGGGRNEQRVLRFRCRSLSVVAFATWKINRKGDVG